MLRDIPVKRDDLSKEEVLLAHIFLTSDELVELGFMKRVECDPDDLNGDEGS